MLKQIQLRIKPEVAYQDLPLKIEVSTLLDIDVNRIKQIDITKRSIDARQRQIMVNLTINVHIDEIHPEAEISSPVLYTPLPENAPKAIVVGAGPAGLFAALKLIECGVCPILL